MSNIACPVCFDASDTFVEEQGDLPPDLRHCPSCDHIFQWPLEVKARYDYQYVHSRYDSYPTTDTMSHLRLGFVQAVSPHKGRLLDVGYGNGSFLKLAAKAGFDTFGNDVHGCGERYGIREVNLNGTSWDIVTFFDSLEHFADLSLPRHVCQNAGRVVISVPHRPHHRDIPGWKHYRPGEHLHLFCVRSLDRFLEGKRREAAVALEDVIRGSRGGIPNIMTYAYRS